MDARLEETVYLDFVTSAPSGAATDADSTPTAEAFEDATDTTVVALTVTKRTSKTGNYRVPVPCTTANGFEAGKSYNVVASATVSGVAAKAVVGRFVLRPAAAVANVTQWRGTSVPAPTQAGYPLVDVAYAAGVLTTSADGTAQGGGTNTVTLAAGDAAGANAYLDRRVTIVAGTGVGQSRYVIAYNSSTKVATVHRAWDTVPDSTSQYAFGDTAAADAVRWGGVAVTGMPMPTYAQPAGFLAATFPSDPADASDIAAAFTGLLTAVTNGFTAVPAAVRDVNNTAPAANSLGARVNSAASAGDPWATPEPGTYPSGTFGAKLAGLPSASQVSAAVLAAGDVDGFTLEQTLKLCLAALAGKLSGAGGTTITIRAADDSKARITAIVDADGLGNRTAVTYDVTG